MKTLVAAAAMAVGMSVAMPVSAGAGMEWCDWDPVVAIVTPAGNVVLVYDSVWTSGPTDVGLPVASYTASRVYDEDGLAQTAVDMVITVPSGLLVKFSTTDMVTTGPLGSGAVLSQANGTSGTAVHLHFILKKP